MISHFFIDRPIFASVLSIIITLAGALAAFSLPITQYPPIAPPSVQVQVSYPGASAQVVADTVAAPIEQQVNGVEDMLYMSSQSCNDGSYTLTVTFDLGTDLNTALVLVQNRVSLAMPQLPESVQRQGITIKKKSPNILLVVNFYSPDGRYDDIYLSNYATIHAKDELLRVDGVSDINYLGERDYSIRAWLDPLALASRDMTATEVAQAVEAQSQPVAAGQLAQQPAAPHEAFQLPLDAIGRLTAAEQFGDIVLKASRGVEGISPRVVRLRDVARVELGAQNYNQSATIDGQPTVGLAIYQLPTSNALDVAERVRTKMEELKKRFPEGIDYLIAYDTTPFIQESVVDVIHTLRDAVILVALVVLAFLQSWRAAVIPLVAVPVAILGACACMVALGFSLNNISLFGLVLAIGIVVDDAIVVVENVERWLGEGYAPREAARRAMDEVTGPVVAVAVVLCAVFVPCAFITGITGQFFRQFAVTIAASTVISAINSLTLSPALASILLKPHGARRDPLEWVMNWTLGWFFWLFNRSFDAATAVYARLVGGLLRASLVALLVYAGLVALTAAEFVYVPKGFIPQQDQGWLLVSAQLPDSASVQRTQAVMAKIDRIARAQPGVAHAFGVSGMSILLSVNSSNFGSMFVVLDPFDKRQSPDLSADAIMMALRKEFGRQISDAAVSVFGAPPVPGIGVASGFKLMVEDRGSLGLQALGQNTDALVAAISKHPDMLMVSTLFRAETPQLWLDIDRTKVRSMGVDLSEVDQTLQIYLGSYYVNSFNEFGRFWQVNLMADQTYRNRVADLDDLWVRNNKGRMAPLATLATARDYGGPVMVNRYNLYTAAPITGVILPFISSGQGISIIEGLAAKTLPRSMSTEWTELTFMEIRAGNTAMYVFALAVVFVFLALAALYESWSLPLAVILVVPMCMLCSVTGVALSRRPINIFVQIGLVVLVGLACKNAILIVEFAKQLRGEGKPLAEATREACRMRLRPILMTSLAFILGVVPLVIASGAGAEMRQSLGIAVFSGMLGVTFFGLLLTPIFFFVIERLGETKAMQNRAVRWIGSTLAGALAGAVIGLLLWKLEFCELAWALASGVSLGMTASWLAMGIHHARRQATRGGNATTGTPTT